MIRVNWAQVKNFLDQRGASAQYVEFSDSYLVAGVDGPFRIYTFLSKTTPSNSDQTDFETNYKNSGNASLEPNYSGAYILPISVTPSSLNNGTTFWAMRNNTSGKRMYIVKVVLTLNYGGALNSVTPSSLSFARFSGATPSGGSLLAAIKANTTFSVSNLLDARQANGGINMTNTIIEGAFIPMNVVSQSATSTTFNFLYPLDHEFTLFTLNPGEGICMQAASSLLSGVTITGFIEWAER